MGRTATVFLVLLAVGGCVSDDQGPLAQFPAAKPGQPGVSPSYATWNRPPDQFAALQDDTTPASAHGTPAGTKPNTTTVQKPAGAEAGRRAGAGRHQAAAAFAGVRPVRRRRGFAAGQRHVGHLAQRKIRGGFRQERTAASHPNLDVDQAASDPAAPSIRMVNSKRVTLNFELKDVGASGVSGVELWCTQDAHAWKKGEIVAQTNHSFTVEVKEEGLYGFTLLARNGSGVGKDAPASGEQPQTWVMVDVTKPTVQISSVEIGHGKEPTVEIHWTAKDKNLGPKPITLSYAEQPEGPWTPIAAGVENCGQYEWTPPAAAPHRLYLRVEAVDMPGNTASAQTANPLSLDVAVLAPAAAAGRDTQDAAGPAGPRHVAAHRRHPGRGAERELRLCSRRAGKPRPYTGLTVGARFPRPLREQTLRTIG